MGLAASQARYLTLTARKSDLELQSQTINSRRIQLSYKTAAIAEAYTEGMNNKMIKIANNTTDSNGDAKTTWENLNFSNLSSKGYMIIGTNGNAIKPSPYVLEGAEENVYNCATEGGSIATADYNKLSANDKKAYVASYVSGGTTVTTTGSTTTTVTTGTSVTTDASTGSTTTTPITSTTTTPVTSTTTTADTYNYVLRSSVTEDVYNNLSDETKAKFSSSPTSSTVFSYNVNPDYNGSENAMDLQSLLVSGKAQIVTQDFFNYLVKNGGYTFETGIQSGTFAEWMDKWQSDTSVNPSSEASIIDWRSDETSTFKQVNYTEDDEAVIAEYERATAEVQAQDKILEMQEKNIETQHKAIETELENVKKVIQKNIEDTFKIFS